MKPFNLKKRESQLEYLDKQDSKETLGSRRTYIIKSEDGKIESCQCAGTASMLLETQFKSVNVWITTI